jgi:NHL repeat-containing protein
MSRACRASLVFAFACVTLAVVASGVSASKQVYDYFGTPTGFGSAGGEFDNPRGIAVNNSGAGPAEKGEIYVVDGSFPNPPSNRIERFSRDENSDYHFISAWGAGVESGGTDYQICTIAANCRDATASGGNGTLAGDGSLDEPRGIAVDQDSGEVYVTDSGNNRVNVYAGDGTFLRSFGYDVIASGPDQILAPDDEQLLTVKATGGKFSLFFAGKTTGAKGTGRLAKGSQTVSKVITTSGAFAVGQPISDPNGFIPSGTTIAAVNAETLVLSQPATQGANNQELTADNLPYNAPAGEVQTALNALPSIGGVGGSVTVTGGPGNETGSAPYTIHFGGSLGGEDVAELSPHVNGLTIASGSPSATVSTLTPGGALEVCRAAASDICRGGSSGAQAGEIGDGPQNNTAEGIAVSQPDGNPATGTVFLADGGNHRVDTYHLDGSSPASFGSAVFKVGVGFAGEPQRIAVDSRGIVYASNSVDGDAFERKIERYDSQNADGGGVGFLAPIPGPLPEVQQLTINASAGQYKLSFGGKTTSDLTYNLGEPAFEEAQKVQKALEALSSIGSKSVSVSSFQENNPRAFKINFFGGALANQDLEQITASNGTTPLSGGGGASVTTLVNGHPGPASPVSALAVSPDPDGAGPETDVLYAATGEFVKQFGPLNKPGLTAPPSAADEEHGTTSKLGGIEGLAIDEASGDLYTTGSQAASKEAHGVYVLGTIGPPPAASLDSIDEITATTARVHATINPHGPANVSYHLEYSLDGTSWKSTANTLVGQQEAPQAISALLNPSPAGLEPNTAYHARLVATKPGSAPVVTSELIFTTLAEAPQVETTGSPLRTATTARLEGRVNPRGLTTTYRFEYGDQGPCDSSPCEAGEPHPAGSADQIELVSQAVEGLQPNTTYHYRVVADNGAPGSPSYGSDMTVTTRESDEPLSHGHLPGPPGSDRAYEQVSMPDSGGNPIFEALGFSSQGDRALFRVAGGTPISDAGTYSGLYFAQRSQSGWQSERIGPTRDQLAGPSWEPPIARSDLSSIFAINVDYVSGGSSLWRLEPQGQPTQLFQPTAKQSHPISYGLSTDGTMEIADLKGGELDPAHPEAAEHHNLYDLGSGTPQLVDLLPGNTVPACGVVNENISPFTVPRQASHWISADGSLVFFSSRGNSCSSQPQLFERKVEAEETKLISGPPVSGPSCGAALLKATPDAAFFWTQSRLATEDTGVGSCDGEADGDVYRYDLGDGTLRCVTCVVSGIDADVRLGNRAPEQLSVADDGSRLYFSTKAHLLAGANDKGQVGAYRVEIATGDLAYVAPLEGNDTVGETENQANAITPDGSVLLFRSKDPGLNALGGQQNGGAAQYYLYDDRDHSLICASCPQDGSLPVGADVRRQVTGSGTAGELPELSLTPLAADGTFAFGTPTALVRADQNTPGPGQNQTAGEDVYEWRDGRLLLVSDGLTSWPFEQEPRVAGITPSGGDLYFLAAAQYTPDAIDAYTRLYDARVGGGFEFPTPPPACPLEVCQGTPKGAPEEQPPGSSSFAGPGNAKQKQRHKKRHHKKRHHKANPNRRAQR